MSTTTIRRVPDEFADARLYLDDIEDFKTMIEAAFANDLVEFEYVLDKTTRITTLDELLKHSGFVTQFDLVVVVTTPLGRTYPRVVLSINKQSKPTFSVPARLNENDAYALYAKMQGVFRSRVDRFKQTVGQVPYEALFGLMLLAIVVFVIPLANALKTKHHSNAWSLLYMVLVFLAGVIVYAKSRRNRVYLRFFREDTLSRRRKLHERLAKFGWLIAGAVMAAIGSAIVNHFQKGSH